MLEKENIYKAAVNVNLKRTKIISKCMVAFIFLSSIVINIFAAIKFWLTAKQRIKFQNYD